MEFIKVNIEDMAGKRYKANLPDDVPVNRLLPQIIKIMNLSLTNQNGRRLSYRLEHVQSGIQLRDSDTLQQAGVKADHTLRLLVDLVAGTCVMLKVEFSISYFDSDGEGKHDQ